MKVTQKIINDIAAEIERQNKEIGPQGIPHSDLLIKFIQSNLGIPIESAKLAIRFLIESHRLLSIEIVIEDSKHSVDKVEGYITADTRIITPLKNYFQEILCQLYEKQFKKHLMIHQVIKEIFPIIKSFNNTELGQIANKTIMLMEYERMLEKNYASYSVDFQERSMAVIAQREHFNFIPTIDIPEVHYSPDAADAAVANGVKEQNSGRAIDSPQYKDYSEKKNHYPIQRILNIYGIDFFLKVNLRKNKFSEIKKLVEDKQITKHEDLMLLRSMLDKIKANIFTDRDLERKREDIYALERVVSHAIYFTSGNRKPH